MAEIVDFRRKIKAELQTLLMNYEYTIGASKYFVLILSGFSEQTDLFDEKNNFAKVFANKFYCASSILILGDKIYVIGDVTEKEQDKLKYSHLISKFAILFTSLLQDEFVIDIVEFGEWINVVLFIIMEQLTHKRNYVLNVLPQDKKHVILPIVEELTNAEIDKLYYAYTKKKIADVDKVELLGKFYTMKHLDGFSQDAGLHDLSFINEIFRKV